MIYPCKVMNSAGKIIKVISTEEILAREDIKLKELFNNPYTGRTQGYLNSPGSFNMFPSKSKFGFKAAEGWE